MKTRPRPKRKTTIDRCAEIARLECDLIGEPEIGKAIAARIRQQMQAPKEARN